METVVVYLRKSSAVVYNGREKKTYHLTPDEAKELLSKGRVVGQKRLSDRTEMYIVRVPPEVLGLPPRERKRRARKAEVVEEKAEEKKVEEVKAPIEEEKKVRRHRRKKAETVETPEEEKKVRRHRKRKKEEEAVIER